MTEEDRVLQQAFAYMNKYIDYFKNIQRIQNLKFIPSQVERSLMLENFLQYLKDARYYIRFYHKYSKYWAPEATRSIEVIFNFFY